MNTDGSPGLDHQSTVRTVARVAAVVLLLVGAVLGFMGVSAFVADFQSMDGGPGPILTAAAGGFCIGWLRTQASYVAGETMPVLKDSATYLSDGQGLGNVGRTPAPAAAEAGPYCRQCGTRNDADARFCDSCGQSLA